MYRSGRKKGQHEPQYLNMGSDDGKKQRADLTRQPWLSAGLILFVVIVVLAYAQYYSTTPAPTTMARTREAVIDFQLAPTQQTSEIKQSSQPTSGIKQSSRPSSGNKLSSLKERLLAMAWMAPADVLAALDADPLNVDIVSNASDWQCPMERLVTVEPSLVAERGLRSFASGYFLWFEHLSKAGGTSFCEFARKNVGFQKTPKYYCMPSSRESGDGRVGRWETARIREYVLGTGHVVLANEWDAFPAGALLDSDLAEKAVLAVFVRDPIDRLLSAYKFWGKLHNPNPNPKPAPEWLADRDAIARRRPHRLFPNDFLSQVARSNFAVWKFSSANRPDLEDCGRNVSCGAAALRIAIDHIEKFHIAVPMLWQDAAKSLYLRFGWTETGQVHKVPSGRIQNSNARSELGPHFEEFRRRNALDYIFWAFVRRAFLERVHCPRPTALASPPK